MEGIEPNKRHNVSPEITPLNVLYASELLSFGIQEEFDCRVTSSQEGLSVALHISGEFGDDEYTEASATFNQKTVSLEFDKETQTITVSSKRLN